MDETINPAKLNSELVLKPIISELVRTQVCFPNLKLLVDRISVVTLPSAEQSKSTKAYRLYLTDGEKSIQAVLKRKIHKYILDLDVREGTYIILRTYRLARGKKLSGSGDVVYIEMEDFYPIGEEQRDDDEIKIDRYCELIRTPQNHSYRHSEEDYGGTKRRIFDSRDGKSQGEKEVEGSDNSVPYDSTPESLKNYDIKEKNTISKLGHVAISPFSPNSPSLNQSGKRVKPFEEIDPNLTPRPSKIPKLNQSPLEVRKPDKKTGHAKIPYSTSSNPAVAKHLELCKIKRRGDINNMGKTKEHASDHGLSKTNLVSEYTRQPTKPNEQEYTKAVIPFKASNSPSPYKSSTIGRPKALLPIKRPLNIRSLDSVTGRHACRNKVYDFFAVVFSVDESVVKPSAMPLKRDMRIVDPSTDKKVTLSVFVDPQNFKPPVGTIALFRSLTTHEWDRGMLNAYPQQCEGKDWFIVDPVNIEGCNLQDLREWWKKKSAETDL